MTSNKKLDARRANEYFNKIKALDYNFTDIDKYINESNEKGTMYTLIEIDNCEPYACDNDLLKDAWVYYANQHLNNRWNIYEVNYNTNNTFDRLALIKYSTINISPEQTIEKRYTETKTIEDGFEYKTDKIGNKLKDSLGNFITIKKYKTISADVVEIIQRKTANIRGRVTVEDKYNKNQFSKPVEYTYTWENFAATFKGDRRALCEATLRKIGNHPVLFPNQQYMIAQTNTEWTKYAAIALQ